MKVFTGLLTFFFLSFNLHALEINHASSSINWIAKKITGQHNGTVKIKKDHLKGNDQLTGGEIIMDMNSIAVEDLNGEWADKLINHLKGPDFFNVQNFPTSKLTITKIDDDLMYGKLSIKEKSKDVKISYKREGNTYVGQFTFDRTDYDIKYRSGKFFENLGDKMIYDNVEVKFKILLK